jgi:hypothetical protein
LAAVNGPYLVTSATNGADLTITSVSAPADWLTANAANMAYKLSSVMVITQLNVLHSANLGTALMPSAASCRSRTCDTIGLPGSTYGNMPRRVWMSFFESVDRCSIQLS